MRSIMNKHGIMVKFLLTMILAIIIFAPACLLTSKFFRLSEQGKTNFNDLYKALKDFAKKGEQGKFTGFMMIMDDETYLAKFDQGEQINVFLTRQYDGVRPFEVPVRFKIKPPSECKNDCLILCRKVFVDYEQKEIRCEEQIIKSIKDFNLEPFAIFRHYQAKLPEIVHRGLFVEGYTVTEISHSGTFRRIPVTILHKGKAKDDKAVLTLTGDALEYSTEYKEKYQAYNKAFEEADKAYKVKTDAPEFKVNEKNEIIGEVTLLSGYIFNQNYPTRLTLKLDPRLLLSATFDNPGQYEAAEEYEDGKRMVFSKERLEISDAQIKFVLPLMFASPGEYVIDGEIKFAFDVISTGSTFGHKIIPLQWKIIVKPK